MRKANRRLLISLAALVMAVAIATTTTYAWFSMNTETNVDNIHLQVTSQDGIYMSTAADGVFKKTLTAVDLDTVASFSSIDLKPLTAKAAGAVSLVDGAGTAAVANSYYEFDLFFRSASPYTIQLKNIPTATSASATNLAAFAPAAWAGSNAAWFTSGTIKTTSIANAVRFGFAGDDFAAAANTKIYNPNFDAGFSALGMGVDATSTGGPDHSALNAAHSYYASVNGAVPTTLAETIAPITALSTAMTYKAIDLVNASATDFINGTAQYAMYKKTGTTTADATYALVATPVLADVAEYFKLPISSDALYSSTDDTTHTAVPENGKVTTAAVKFYTQTNPNTLLTLTQTGGVGFFTGKLTVRIWAEGTDADCFEAILGNRLSTALNFVGTVGRIDPQY